VSELNGAAGLPAIEVVNMTKRFRVLHREASVKATILKLLIWQLPQWEDFRALEDITFSVPQGQTLGVIGRNGSGKSTLLSVLARIYRPTSGSITVRGRVSSLLALDAGFQPEFTGYENIYLNGVIYGLSRKEIDRKMDSIVEFADLGNFLTTQVKYYSSGMKARLGFSVAVHVDPDILLVDEVLAVGDVDFQERCYAKIREFKEKGITIFFVSHDLEAMRKTCERVIWIDEHRIRMDGKTEDVLREYARAMHQHAQEVEESTAQAEVS
jgi:ABC-type polysaccharide/polyol phosphate transport system ATPase subunit